MTAPTNPIERSFEIAAERCEDLTPLVYRRLHAEHPETVAMFRTEGSEPVKGSMLALTIEAMLDFAGPRTGHFRMIECEISSHDAYGTPRAPARPRRNRFQRRTAVRGMPSRSVPLVLLLTLTGEPWRAAPKAAMMSFRCCCCGLMRTMSMPIWRIAGTSCSRL